MILLRGFSVFYMSCRLYFWICWGPRVFLWNSGDNKGKSTGLKKWHKKASAHKPLGIHASNGFLVMRASFIVEIICGYSLRVFVALHNWWDSNEVYILIFALNQSSWAINSILLSRTDYMIIVWNISKPHLLLKRLYETCMKRFHAK